MKMFRICLFVSIIVTSCASISTIDKIKKHREWLAKREKGSSFVIEGKSITYSSQDNEVLNDFENFNIKQNTSNNQMVSNSPGTSISSDKSKKPRQRYLPHWTTWSNWSECSRSCGSGAMSQQRKCVTRRMNSTKKFISRECTGIYKRYKLCNTHQCQPSVNFRAQQCEMYNGKLFQGSKYMWEPYIKEEKECELNCKPIGMNYFATLNDVVIDGTSCHRPAEYFTNGYSGSAFCVNGICKAVSRNNIFLELYFDSQHVQCGSIVCHQRTGIFDQKHLQMNSYSYVTTIPKGSFNISITELRNNNNMLALKTKEEGFLMNSPNLTSNSGSYKSQETRFDYYRIDIEEADGVTEWITSSGPTSENVDVYIFVKDINYGVKYEYLLPITSDNDEGNSSTKLSENVFHKSFGGNHLEKNILENKFYWKVIGFSSCSKSCGGGLQIPNIKCVRDNSNRYFPQRKCSNLKKPLLNENLLRCNTQPCPAFWRSEEWRKCNCSVGLGITKREIRCVQELSSGIVIQVNKSNCLGEAPESSKSCQCQSNFSNTKKKRKKIIIPSINSTIMNTGTWMYSNWNERCSTTCGIGFEYRSIFCEKSGALNEVCDTSTSPDISKVCSFGKLCEKADWFISPWGECSGSCFNLTKSRQVLCIQNNLITDIENCNISKKPSNILNCTLDDVDYCKPNWHYSDWSECSKPCAGTQERLAKCLEIGGNKLLYSQKCSLADKQILHRSCNINCSDLREKNISMNEPLQICEDKLIHCALVARANFCTHNFYKNNCCQSCSFV